MQKQIQRILSGLEIEAISKLIHSHESTFSEPGQHYYCFVDLSHAHRAMAAASALDGETMEWGYLTVNRSKLWGGKKEWREQFAETSGPRRDEVSEMIWERTSWRSQERAG